ncbi:MAG: DUF3795 domain-containing protein [Deltaproteobacteria bacterium]|nr:DUF3795 domain-containing protein [Deltaproteobacteria bacterium]
MDYLQMTAPCGLDCFNCPLFAASTNEDLQKLIAQRLNIPLENAKCSGCRNENGTIAAVGMTGPCKVYRCISERGYSFCCDCPDFPCDHLHPYADLAAQRPHNTKVFNLCLIKKMGVEAWAEKKAKEVRDTYYKGKLVL